jgi:hypothetical protein
MKRSLIVILGAFGAVVVVSVAFVVFAASVL